MKRIHYTDDTWLTGSDIADAVVHYAAALAKRGSSEAVDIPVRSVEGSVETISLLLGPASQLVVAPEANAFDEIVDEALVARLNRAADQLSDAAPVSAVEMDPTTIPLLNDFDQQ